MNLKTVSIFTFWAVTTYCFDYLMPQTTITSNILDVAKTVLTTVYQLHLNIQKKNYSRAHTGTEVKNMLVDIVHIRLNTTTLILTYQGS